MKAIIAAAGTGGHINPAIAIANEIMKKEPDSKIIFIGTNHGLETDLVPRAGYELKTIESYGIKRSLSIENIKRFFKTMHSVKDVRKIIKDFKPDVVIGTGGYICVSVMKAAQKEHVKYVLHESNVLPGVATKILAKKASVVLLGFKEAKERLPEETKTVFTGTPTKVADLDYSEKQIEDKKVELGLDKEKKLVLIFGGSQGARSINNAVKDIIINKENEKNVHTITTMNSEKEMNEISFDKDENYEIMWAVGKKQFAGVKEELAKHQIDIDLIVSRSGAMTITEIEKVGKGAIFIPYPYAAENHQEYNARALEKIGAAKVILDKDLNAESLEKMISSLTEDKDVLKHMGEVAKSQSIPNVEEKIYQEIYKAIND